jgi:hypothetical protein
MRRKNHLCPSVKQVLPSDQQNFNYRITIRFEDGSKSVFEYACAWTKDKDQFLDVYTEHCGYHSFRLLGVTSVECIRYGKKCLPSGPFFRKGKLKLSKFIKRDPRVVRAKTKQLAEIRKNDIAVCELPIAKERGSCHFAGFEQYQGIKS